MTRHELTDDQFESRLCDLCDFLVENPKLQTATRYAGWSPKYIWTLLKRSNEGHPKFLIRWPDRECEQRIQFADAVMQARRMWTASFDGVLRRDVSVGQPRTSLYMGQVVWTLDAAALAEWGGDTLQAKQDAEGLGGVVDYPYAHRIGPKGKLERIPLRVYEPAPAGLKQHVARSLMPSVYNPPESRTVATEHSGTVMIVGSTRPAYAKDYVPPADTATPMQRDLRARLADLRANGPKNPYPLDAQGRKTIPAVNTGGDKPGDPPERQGRGELPQLDADGNVRGRPNRVPPMISKGGHPAPGGFDSKGRPT